MNNFTFLTKDQIFGDNRLKIFEEYGTKAAITDFSILLGGYVDNCHCYNNNSLENRTGWYWTNSDDKDNDARVVTEYGTRSILNVKFRYGGARPALPYSSMCNISSNMVRGRNGILEVEYGQYPQKVAPKELQNQLEWEYFNRASLKRTGKTYTTDSRKYNKFDEKFKAQIIEEYSFNDGKKYVRVKANSCFTNNQFMLSNGKSYKDGDYVWVEVSPIKWLVDEENDIAVSEKILFSGIQFNNVRNYKGDFENTDIKKFIDEYFSKDIVPSNTIIKSEDINKYEILLEKLLILLNNKNYKEKIEEIKKSDPNLNIIRQIFEEEQITTLDNLYEQHSSKDKQKTISEVPFLRLFK